MTGSLFFPMPPALPFSLLSRNKNVHQPLYKYTARVAMAVCMLWT